MDSSAEHQFPHLKNHYLEAAEKGFPAFIRSVEDSNPINATPYVVALSEFLAQDFSPVRQALADKLREAFAELSQAGLKPEIMLVGGSFLVADAVPKDIDAVIYYSRETESRTDLVAWCRHQHARGLDLRLMPIEMDPVIVLKTAVFFGVLYAINRTAGAPLRGVVLVDCSR